MANIIESDNIKKKTKKFYLTCYLQQNPKDIIKESMDIIKKQTTTNFTRTIRNYAQYIERESLKFVFPDSSSLKNDIINQKEDTFKVIYNTYKDDFNY